MVLHNITTPLFGSDDIVHLTNIFAIIGCNERNISEREAGKTLKE